MSEQNVDIEKELKRRDNINSKIEVHKANNEKIDKEVSELIVKAKDEFGIEVTVDNLDDLIAKFKALEIEEGLALKEANDEAEEWI